MFILERVGGFRSRDLQHTLRKSRFQVSPTPTGRTQGCFFDCDEAARHKFKIGFPGRIIIGYPVNENFNTNMIFLCPPQF